MDTIEDTFDAALLAKLFQSSPSNVDLEFQSHSFDIEALVEHDWIAKTITLKNKPHILIKQLNSECSIHIFETSKLLKSPLDAAIKNAHERAGLLHVFSNPLKASKTAILCSLRHADSTAMFRIYSTVQIDLLHIQLLVLDSLSIAELYNNLTDFESLIDSLKINMAYTTPSVTRNSSLSTLKSVPKSVQSIKSIQADHYFASESHPDSIEGIFWCSGTKYNINTLFLTHNKHITSSFPAPGHLTHFSGSQIEEIMQAGVAMSGLFGKYTFEDKRMKVKWRAVFQEDPLFLENAIVVTANQIRFDGLKTSDVFNRGHPFSMNQSSTSGLFISVLDSSVYISFDQSGTCQTTSPQILDAFSPNSFQTYTYHIHYFTLEVSNQLESQFFSICKTGINNDIWIEGIIYVESTLQELTPEDAQDSYTLHTEQPVLRGHQPNQRPLSHARSNQSFSQPPPNLFGLTTISSSTLEGLFTSYNQDSTSPFLTLTFVSSIPLVYGGVPNRGALSTTTASSLQDIIKSQAPPQKAVSGTYRMLITGLVQVAWKTLDLAKECAIKPKELVSVFKIIENGIVFDRDAFGTLAPLTLTKARAFNYSGACIASTYSRNKSNPLAYLSFELNGKITITDQDILKDFGDVDDKAFIYSLGHYSLELRNGGKVVAFTIYLPTSSDAVLVIENNVYYKC